MFSKPLPQKNTHVQWWRRRKRLSFALNPTLHICLRENEASWISNNDLSLFTFLIKYVFCYTSWHTILWYVYIVTWNEHPVLPRVKLAFQWVEALLASPCRLLNQFKQKRLKMDFRNGYLAPLTSLKKSAKLILLTSFNVIVNFSLKHFSLTLQH